MRSYRPLIENEWSLFFGPAILRTKTGGDEVQIEIRIDQNCKEPRVLITIDQMTEEINELMKRLQAASPQMLAGFQEDQAEPLSPDEIIRVYAASGKVFAVTKKGEYVLRMRLYEAEERLNRKFFVRISQSELVNLKQVKRFDLSFIGTIGLLLSDGTTSYASRRYVAKIRQLLEM